MLNMKGLQHDIARWAERNFPAAPEITGLRAALGMCEEMGELALAMLKGGFIKPRQLLGLVQLATGVGRVAHHVLKWNQGIRGTKEEHEGAILDAICDTFIYGMHLASVFGFELEPALSNTAVRVMRRDFVKDPRHGGEPADAPAATPAPVTAAAVAAEVHASNPRPLRIDVIKPAAGTDEMESLGLAFASSRRKED